MTLLVVPALAAALIGRFTSFWLTLGSALAIGVAESEMANYVSEPGWAKAAPFLVVIAVLVARGRSLPERGERAVRLPRVGRGRARLVPVLVLCGLTVALISWVSVGWVERSPPRSRTRSCSSRSSCSRAYTGQLSLAQYAIAGLGACIVGPPRQRRPASLRLALLIGVFGAIPLGLLVRRCPRCAPAGSTSPSSPSAWRSAIERLIFDQLRPHGRASAARRSATRELFGLDISSSHAPGALRAFYARGAACSSTLVVATSAAADRPQHDRRAHQRARPRLLSASTCRGAKLYAFSLVGGDRRASAASCSPSAEQSIIYTNFDAFSLDLAIACKA